MHLHARKTVRRDVYVKLFLLHTSACPANNCHWPASTTKLLPCLSMDKIKDAWIPYSLSQTQKRHPTTLSPQQWSPTGLQITFFFVAPILWWFTQVGCPIRNELIWRSWVVTMIGILLSFARPMQVAREKGPGWRGSPNGECFWLFFPPCWFKIATVWFVDWWIQAPKYYWWQFFLLYRKFGSLFWMKRKK